MIGGGRSGSRWLDRLRTAKGFPATDLAHSVQNPSPPGANNPFQPAAMIVTDVLHELFNFGGGGIRVRSRKSARKQSNPRVCALDENERNGSRVEEEEEVGEVDLTGFSMTDVTVIDTSCEVWKSDKLLYRKKNAWRVRDRKGSSIRSVGRKKARGKKVHDWSDR